MTDDLVAPLPTASDITKAEPPKTEKLIYPEIVRRVGWR
jgi:hypothetical protein